MHEVCCKTLHVIEGKLVVVGTCIRAVVRQGLTTVKVKEVVSVTPHLRVPYNVTTDVPTWLMSSLIT